jgi:hypothetical protein
MRGGLTNKVFIVTKYRQGKNDRLICDEKFDVTDQFAELARTADNDSLEDVTPASRDQLVQAVRSVPILRGSEIILGGGEVAVPGPIFLNFAEAEAIVDAVVLRLSNNSEMKDR